jgi:integrase
LCLTAARLREVIGMRWDELDFHTSIWTIAAERSKNRNDQRLPLSRQAVEIIAGQPRLHASPYVFTHDGDRPVSGEVRAKQVLDKLSGVKGWTYHDLRRSAATRLAEDLDIDDALIERILGHKVGTKIARTYNLAKREKRMREALQGFADMLTGANVNEPAGEAEGEGADLITPQQGLMR